MSFVSHFTEIFKKKNWEKKNPQVHPGIVTTCYSLTVFFLEKVIIKDE